MNNGRTDFSNGWPLGHIPDKGDIESALYERGLLAVTEWHTVGLYLLDDGTTEPRRVQRTRIVARCRFGDHPAGDYATADGVCVECDGDRAKDAYVDRLIDERRCGRGGC